MEPLISLIELILKKLERSAGFAEKVNSIAASSFSAISIISGLSVAAASFHFSIEG